MLVQLGRNGYRLARRIVIGVVGGTVVLIGVVMLVTPGPGLVVIPTGLAILAIEFAWARRWLKRLKANLSKEQLNGYLVKARKLGVKSPPADPPP
jgi:tellurite resistance protein TerC